MLKIAYLRFPCESQLAIGSQQSSVVSGKRTKNFLKKEKGMV